MNAPFPNPAISAALLQWFDQLQIQLPWRGSRDPYRIWLSEIMLQQTRIAAVEGYYARFLERFPTLEALAAAPLDEVLKAWEGLGYYSRARNLHAFAQTIVNEHHGQFPTTAKALQELPGIGRYTAAALASIAFDEPVAVLDGNVMRVLARLTDLAEDITEPRTQEHLWHLAESLLPLTRPGDYNQALMDLGRLVCVPRRPHCEACPWQAHCLAFAHHTTAQRPVKKPKPPRQQVNVVAAVLRDAQQRLLLVQRPPQGLLGGLWTLPGGVCAAGESFADALQRTLRNDLRLEINVTQQMAAATQDLTHLRMTVRAFAGEIRAGVPEAAGVAAFAWVSEADLAKYSLGKADREIVNALAKWQPRLFEESE
ncbi:MAG TPA: A/G-specific adenine glycosylase [Blastocatellia bacterium]|nr:A/G-specific adenine glycosylase [Blastocatellia bacterium]